MFDFGAILTEIMLKMRMAESDCVIINSIATVLYSNEMHNNLQNE